MNSWRSYGNFELLSVPPWVRKMSSVHEKQSIVHALHRSVHSAHETEDRAYKVRRESGRQAHWTSVPDIFLVHHLMMLTAGLKVEIITYPHFAHGSIEARKIARLFQGHVASGGWSQSAPALHLLTWIVHLLSVGTRE